MDKIYSFLFLFLAVTFSNGIAVTQPYLVSGDEKAPLYGVHEAQFFGGDTIDDPFFNLDVQAEFTRPDGSLVTVDAFYDGSNNIKARAYCNQTGIWKWASHSNHKSIPNQTGTFIVIPSSLQGKLKKHPRDPYQFAYDNGDWFLHIGDTGYRYVVQSEPKWKEYIDQASDMGITKIRTWFAQARGTVEILFTEDRNAFNLPYWQEIGRRIQYALNHHPHIILQLIPYAEDTEEIKRYGKGDPASLAIARYAQARWSAFSNVHWTISNDREIVEKGPVKGRQVLAETINRMGRDMAEREPWGTLLTNHQSRFKGYSFTGQDWSDIITLEDMDQVTGEIILAYREKGQDPVVMDEDRYEWHRNPSNDRYFFRRLMWASLLSGGHATYGGLRTYEAYNGGPVCGVQGYYTANRLGMLEQGGHDFNHIHSFFQDSGLTPVGMQPDDNLVGGDPKRWKCIHNRQTYIVYAANPDGSQPNTDNPRFDRPTVSIELPGSKFTVKWFNPRSGEWFDGKEMDGGKQQLQPPKHSTVTEYADWVLLLRKKNS